VTDRAGWGSVVVAVSALMATAFIAGVMLTPILTVAAGFRNGGQLVAQRLELVQRRAHRGSSRSRMPAWIAASASRSARATRSST